LPLGGEGRSRAVEVVEESVPSPTSTNLHDLHHQLSPSPLLSPPHARDVADLRAQQLGIAVALIPLLWAALHVVRSSTSFLGGALSDRIGPSRTMWIGWLSYVALAAAMGVARSPLAAWVLFSPS